MSNTPTRAQNLPQRALPIDDALPALHAALSSRAGAVLEAPPGAGKTTRVPLALLNAPWLEQRRIVMLEPRRLAARAAAQFMARSLGERVGDTVGYRVRGDTVVSSRTRIEVVTEGVLTRLLADDPTLESYGAVLFDEFHERSLQADVGLALTLETQQLVRPTLRILVMSATLDGAEVARLIGAAGDPAPVIRSDGRMFPVVTHHRPPRSDERIDAAVARTVREAVAEHDGDVLVFLPGMSEQRRVADRLRGDDTFVFDRNGARIDVHVLHGTMPLAEQDAAIAPAPEGARKVVLATSIAETSLTIEGVRVVVDSGLSRLPRYDARAGLTRLDTVRVSRASADQRRGRAGRVAPGVCYRVWHHADDHALVPRTRPEMLDADLAALALDLANAGVHDPTALRWMDVPPAGAYAQARELLTQLGALDASGRMTAHGQAMARLPLAPRLAHLLLEARARGRARLGAELVALLEERDVLRGDGAPPPADLRLRVEALRREGHSTSLHGASIDRDGMRRVRDLAQQLQRDVRSGDSRNVAPTGADDIDDTGALLALAYPDRVARSRSSGDGRLLMRGGTGAAVVRGDALYDQEWLAIAELDGAPPEYRVARAAPLSLAEVRDDFATQIVEQTTVEWHEPSRSVRARRRSTLGAITIDESTIANLEPLREATRNAMLAQLRRGGIESLPISDAGRRTRERIECVRLALGRNWPDLSNAALTDTLEQWLAPHLDGITKSTQLEALDWNDVWLSMLSWEQRRDLDTLAPTHIEVPSGSRIAIDYSDAAAPVLAVKLQEVFGWTTTPLICAGRTPLTLHLLSPAQRPVQVTRDLAGFWRTSYFDVRKELRGRYPRHPWPDDPLSATPTRRAKPRGT